MDANSYNHMYLCGDLHITDDRYCEMMGLDLSLAGTPEINNKFLEENPKHAAFLDKKYAEKGLL